MKLYLVIVLLLTLISLSFGQKPSALPTPKPSTSTEQIRTKNFGSSLKKYEKKKRRDSQDKKKSVEPDEDEIYIETDLVVSDVLVTDQKGNIISDLKKDDFVVKEDGTPQTIEVFSRGESATVPRSIVLILDCGLPQGPYLKKSIEATKTLVDKLASNDKMAIATADLKLRLDFTQDKTLLKKTLDSLEAGWWRNIEFDTLLAVLDEKFKEENRQRIIIFQGDGTEIIWLKPDEEHPYPVSYSTLERSGLKYTGLKSIRKFGFSEVREAIEKSRATIYSVIPGIKFLGLSKEEQLARAKISVTETNRFYGWNKEKDLPTIIKYYQYAEAETKTAGQTAMFKIAELSGGNAGFIEKPEDTENIYAEIFTVIKNRYVIGYYPTNQKRDGKRREIKIEVRDHPEYIVTGRKAYFPQ